MGNAWPQTERGLACDLFRGSYFHNFEILSQKPQIPPAHPVEQQHSSNTAPAIMRIRLLFFFLSPSLPLPFLGGPSSSSPPSPSSSSPLRFFLGVSSSSPSPSAASFSSSGSSAAAFFGSSSSPWT